MPTLRKNLVHRIRQCNAASVPLEPTDVALTYASQLISRAGSVIVRPNERGLDEQQNGKLCASLSVRDVSRNPDPRINGNHHLNRKVLSSEAFMRNPTALFQSSVDALTESRASIAPSGLDAVGCEMTLRGSIEPERQHLLHHQQHLPMASRLMSTERAQLVGEPGAPPSNTWDVEHQQWLDLCWEGLRLPHPSNEAGTGSVGTPTGSLYGTEDAATTEGADDTEDALSLSSINHADFRENYVASAAVQNGVANGSFVPNANGRPQCLPLAIPELLTTSIATTASTVDTDVSGHTFLSLSLSLSASQLQTLWIFVVTWHSTASVCCSAIVFSRAQLTV